MGGKSSGPDFGDVAASQGEENERDLTSTLLGVLLRGLLILILMPKAIRQRVGNRLLACRLSCRTFTTSNWQYRVDGLILAGC